MPLPETDAPVATHSRSVDERGQIPCRLCQQPALAVYALSDGCIAEPDDREQALCGTHIMKATPYGSFELVRVLHAGAYAEFIQFWNRDARLIVDAEESENDGAGGAAGAVWRSANG